MRVHLIVALIVAASAAPAGAQTTKCGWEFGQWVCREEAHQPSIFESGMAGWNAGQEAAERRRQAEAADRARIIAEMDAAQAEADRAAKTSACEKAFDLRMADAKTNAEKASAYEAYAGCLK